MRHFVILACCGAFLLGLLTVGDRAWAAPATLPSGPVWTSVAALRSDPVFSSWPRLASRQKGDATPRTEQARFVAEQAVTVLRGKVVSERLSEEDASEICETAGFLMRTFQQAGGYSNHIYTDSAKRIGLVAVSRYLITPDAKLPNAEQLLALVSLPVLPRGDLDAVVREELGIDTHGSIAADKHDAGFLGRLYTVCGSDWEISSIAPVSAQSDLSNQTLESQPDLCKFASRLVTTDAYAATPLSGTIGFLKRGGLLANANQAQSKAFDALMGDSVFDYKFELANIKRLRPEHVGAVTSALSLPSAKFNVLLHDVSSSEERPAEAKPAAPSVSSLRPPAARKIEGAPATTQPSEPAWASVAALRSDPVFSAWPRLVSQQKGDATPRTEQARLVAERAISVLCGKVVGEKLSEEDATEICQTAGFLMQTLQQAGGYSNHIYADSAKRIGLVAASRYLIASEAKLPKAEQLLALVSLPVLPRGDLDAVAREELGIDTHGSIAADKRDAGFLARLFAVCGSDWAAWIGGPISADRDVSNRRLQTKPDIPRLAYRLVETDVSLTTYLNGTIAFLKRGGTWSDVGPAGPRNFGAVMGNSAFEYKSQLAGIGQLWPDHISTVRDAFALPSQTRNALLSDVSGEDNTEEIRREAQRRIHGASPSTQGASPSGKMDIRP